MEALEQVQHAVLLSGLKPSKYFTVFKAALTLRGDQMAFVKVSSEDQHRDAQHLRNAFRANLPTRVGWFKVAIASAPDRAVFVFMPQR